jgi:hypothetical protein
MIELLCALAIGMIFGYLFSKEKHPPIVKVLQNQVEKLEEDVKYYKDLCKWHVERNKHE